jgi:putative FmdB family regulatory protein
MPIYEYACERCDSEFEVEQRITDDPLKRCPSCRSVKVKRLISQTSFVLKGGGWYSDLYSSPKDGKSSSKEEAGSGKQADAKETSISKEKEKEKPKSEGDKKDRKDNKTKSAKAAA